MNLEEMVQLPVTEDPNFFVQGDLIQFKSKVACKN